MNWNAAGAIGEIVGATAVVVSVIYLAIQIRGQTEQAKLAATRDLMNSFNESLDRIVDDPTIAKLWLDGIYAYNDLPNTDRIRVSSLNQRLMRLIEQHHLHIKKGHIDPSFFASMDRAYSDWITKPGVQQWWESAKDMFEAGFAGIVDSQIAAGKERGYESSYKEERERSA